MKTRSIVFLILGTVGVLGILAIAACGGFLYFGLNSTNEKLSPTLDEIFAAIDQGKFVDTYDTLTAPEFRNVMSREQYDTVGKTIKDRLGALKSKSIRSFKMNTMNGKSYLEATYNAQFEKAAAEIVLNTTEIDGQRKIAGFFVKSPALAAPKPVEKPKPADGQPAGEPAPSDKPTDEKPAVEKPAAEKPAGEPKPTEEPKVDAKEPAPANQP